MCLIETLILKGDGSQTLSWVIFLVAELMPYIMVLTNVLLKEF